MVLETKDLGHFWLGYIRMLGHLQLSAHLPNFDSVKDHSSLLKKGNLCVFEKLFYISSVDSTQIIV